MFLKCSKNLTMPELPEVETTIRGIIPYLEKNVISKEGGFIGLGKTTKVKDDFNKDYFTKINIESTTTINIGAKRAKILSSHPHDSYKLVGEKPVEKIEITNAEEFWSASKYLVIVID